MSFTPDPLLYYNSASKGIMKMGSFSSAPLCNSISRLAVKYQRSFQHYTQPLVLLFLLDSSVGRYVVDVHFIAFQISYD